MRLYFMGICGTAMGNAALLARAMGHEVFGADTGMYPPMSEQLAASDATVYEGYDPKRLEKLKPDLVVVGNVIGRGHVEMEWLLETHRFPFISLPAFLHDFILTGRKKIVVSGTHGKTTTTTLTSYLLRANEEYCGWLIGGVPHDLPGGSQLGDLHAAFVIEGDEYDSAFFDKRSKFIHYWPDILVINNMEFDHADIFRDLEDIKRTFRHVTRLVPANGFILMNGDDDNVLSLLPMGWTQILRVGMREENDLRIAGFQETPEGSRFSLIWKGKLWREVKWRIGGLYNARNLAMAALAAGLALHPSDPTRLNLDAVASFKGVRRRQELLADENGQVVVEDFGHHPTAIRDTILSMKNRFPGYLITACFEPRSNTARTNVLQNDFTQALSLADTIYLGHVHRADKLSSEQRLDTETMAAIWKKEGRQAMAFSDNKALLAQLQADAAKHVTDGIKCVTVFFSNGSFDGIIAAFADHVKSL